jgi:hypothetical protein
MISVYCENIQASYIFDHILEKQIFDNINDFKQSQSTFKIALVEKDESVGLKNVREVVDISNLVIVKDSEFHSHHPLNHEQYNWTNVYWYGPGYTKKNNEYVIPYQQHLCKMQQLYCGNLKVNEQLNRLTPYQPKSMSFDALLGQPRPPRVFVIDQIKKHSLESVIVNNIFSNETYTKCPIDQLPGFDWEDDYILLNDNNRNDIYCNIDYHGAVTALTNIIPISTYTQTAFSILSETQHNNSVYMLTEKTAKVTLGRRLFVAFAGPGFLQLLRNTGFQTFDGIIDESYDLIENDQDRWQAAFDQVIKLCHSDQLDTLTKARPILEHNFNTIANYPWQQEGIRLLQEKVTQILNNVQSKI